MFSHRKETCPSEILASIVLKVQNPQIRDDEGRESDRIIKGEIEGGDEAINLEIVEDFRPWMLAKRRIRRVPITQSNQKTLDSLKKGKAKKRAQMNNKHRDFMEGVRQLKYSILDLEEDKVMEGDHTEEEMNKMKMESHIARVGSRTLLSGKGKRANVQIQNSSLIRPSHNLVEKINPSTVHVDKEGGEYQSTQIRKKDILRKGCSGGLGNQATTDDEH